jgi:hypothetical protein
MAWVLQAYGPDSDGGRALYVRPLCERPPGETPWTESVERAMKFTTPADACCHAESFPQVGAAGPVDIGDGPGDGGGQAPGGGDGRQNGRADHG